jgi:hypothetical protein
MQFMTASTNIRSRDKARRRIYVSSVHFIFFLHEKSTARFIKTRYAKVRNNFPSTGILNLLPATRLALALWWFTHGEETVQCTAE